MALIKAGLKVSDLIPDLLFRKKIKEQILNVYKFFITKQHPDLLKEIEVLDGFFFLAGQMNFVKDSHLRVLRTGILVFKSRIILALNEPPKIPADLTPDRAIVKKEIIKPEIQLNERSIYTDRQKKILEKFSAKGGSATGGQNKETLKLAEILELFPDISEKTVRNDLKLLIGLKKIVRNGNGSGSFYQIMR